MAYFVVIACDKLNSLDVRLANREAHIAYAKSLGDKLKVAGPFFSRDKEPKMCGTMMVFDVADMEELRAILAEDPYAKADLFESVSIEPWRPVLGEWAPPADA